MEVKINDNIILVGTAHISKDSVEEVKKVIKKYKPDIVAVEHSQKKINGKTRQSLLF